MSSEWRIQESVRSFEQLLKNSIILFVSCTVQDPSPESDAGSDVGAERWYSMHKFELSHDHPIIFDTPAFLPSYHSAIFIL